MIDWLPEETSPDGTGRPIRPDLPWFRNLSWTKLHAIQLGFAFGLLLYFLISLNEHGVAISLIILAVEYIISESRRVDPASSCNHRIGLHDIIEKPWYFASTIIVTYGALYLVSIAYSELYVLGSEREIYGR